MTWHDNILTGSFRDAEFKWKNSETTVGRKTARHDYPKRDDAYIEDMGCVPREFVLECFVIGPDYMNDRNAMIEALEEEGPGILVHPTMGVMTVCVSDKVKITETTSEGGMCRFSIPCVLAGEKPAYPTSTLDTAGDVDKKADAAIEKVEEAFAEKFTVENQPGFVANDSVTQSTKIVDSVDSVSSGFSVSTLSSGWTKNITKIKSTLSGLIATPLKLARSVTGIINQVRGMALEPLNLLSGLKSAVTGYWNQSKSIVDIPMSIFNAYAKFFDFGKLTSTFSTTSSASISQTTPARIAQAKNRDALNALVRTTAIIEAARTSSTIQFKTIDEAVAVRNTLMDAIDEEILTASDSVFNALVDLRAAVITDIRMRGANLARSVKYTPLQTEPALVIAHRLYGDATRADEIIVRNKIRHPLFVQGGVDLEVYSD